MIVCPWLDRSILGVDKRNTMWYNGDGTLTMEVTYGAATDVPYP